MPKKRERSESEETVEKINTKKQKINEQDEDDFTSLGIDKNVVEKLKEKSIVSLFEVQKKVFKPIYGGKNTICASLTGSGKTLSFVLPILQRNKDKERFNHKIPVCMVMAPTRELSIQVAREFSDLNSKNFDFKVALIYGGVSIEDQIHKLRAGVDIIVGTPGRIMDMIERGQLILKDIRTVVLDEADKMLSMGFEEQIVDIFNKIYNARSKIQVCLFSATIERWVRDVANKIIKGEQEYIDLVKDLGGRTPKTVQHLAVNSLKSDKVTTIADLILCYGGINKSTIVFVNTKRECNDLMISDKIKQEVQIIHGDINQKQREATIEGFKKGKFKCLVATDVASRGLDIPMVDLVIQSEPPKEVDTYIHRAGRTARAGRSGICITLYSRYTEGLITRIEQKAKIKFKKIGAPQRNEIVESSIRDIKTAISDIDDSMIKLFQKSSTNLIDEYGAENAVARLFAYISGHTEKMKSRSLLCGAEGFITYTIKFKSKFNHMGYVWGFFKRILPEAIKSKIRGMRVFKSMDGCVFDYPEEGHKDFEEIIFNDRLYGDNYTLSNIEELPELMENSDGVSTSNSRDFRNGGHSSSNYAGSSGRSFSAGSKFVRSGRSDRSNRMDIFIGNIPFGSEESQLKQWVEKHGVDTSDIDIRFAVDKDSNQMRGFGFISVYDKEKQAKILELNGKQFNHKVLRINDANTK